MKKRNVKLKKDDNVKIISGKDKGKTGRVLRIMTNNERVIIQGLNMVKKTVKPKKQQEKGGITDVEASMNISKVMIICKKCGPTRIGYKYEAGDKIRICKKCGETI